MHFISNSSLRNAISYIKPMKLSSAELDNLKSRLTSKDCKVKNVAIVNVKSRLFQKRVITILKSASKIDYLNTFIYPNVQQSQEVHAKTVDSSINVKHPKGLKESAYDQQFILDSGSGKSSEGLSLKAKLTGLKKVRGRHHTKGDKVGFIAQDGSINKVVYDYKKKAISSNSPALKNKGDAPVPTTEMKLKAVMAGYMALGEAMKNKTVESLNDTEKSLYHKVITYLQSEIAKEFEDDESLTPRSYGTKPPLPPKSSIVIAEKGKKLADNNPEASAKSARPPIAPKPLVIDGVKFPTPPLEASAHADDVYFDFESLPPDVKLKKVLEERRKFIEDDSDSEWED